MSDQRQFVQVDEFRRRLATKQAVSGLGVRKGFSVRAEPEGDPKKDGPVTFVISTAAVDSYGDTIAVDGWDTQIYESNPIVLWGHNAGQPPIGRAQKVYVEGDALKSVCEFTPDDVNPFGAMVGRMVRQGFLNATSVGFEPLEYVYNEERKGQWGQPGIDFQKQRLLEYSVVSIPANPEALIEAKAFGAFKAAGGDIAPMLQFLQQHLDGGEHGLWLPRATAEALHKELGPNKFFSLPTPPAPEKKAAPAGKRTLLVVEGADEKALKALHNQAKVGGFTLREADDTEEVLSMKGMLAKFDESLAKMTQCSADLGTHCASVGSHSESLAKSAEAMGQHCAAIEEALKGDEPTPMDEDKAGAATATKGGAPHKLSKKSEAELAKAEKALKAMRSLHESGKVADEPEPKPDEDDKASDPDSDGDDDSTPAGDTDNDSGKPEDDKKDAPAPEVKAPEAAPVQPAPPAPVESDAQKAQSDLDQRLRAAVARNAELTMKLTGAVPAKPKTT